MFIQRKKVHFTEDAAVFLKKNEVAFNQPYMVTFTRVILEKNYTCTHKYRNYTSHVITSDHSGQEEEK
jgi:hypothetical protein